MHWYMRSLEEVAIVAMEDLGVRNPGRVKGLTGAWANVRGDGDGEEDGDGEDRDGEDRDGKLSSAGVTPEIALANREHKVAAIGVRARRWVTYHGMAFNVDPTLTDFAHIVPCGIGDRPVGSVAQLLQGRAGIISSSDGDTATSGGGDNGGGGGGPRAGAGAGAVNFVNLELMSRARESLLAAFEQVFDMELARRGGPPPV